MAQRRITGRVCWGRPSVSGKQSRLSGQSRWNSWIFWGRSSPDSATTFSLVSEGGHDAEEDILLVEARRSGFRVSLRDAQT